LRLRIRVVTDVDPGRDVIAAIADIPVRHGQAPQVDIVAAQHDLLARRLGRRDHARLDAPFQALDHGPRQRLRGDAKRERDPVAGAEQVGQGRHPGALDVLEQQCGAALIGDQAAEGADLVDRIDLLADTQQLAALLEARDEIAERAVGRGGIRGRMHVAAHETIPLRKFAMDGIPPESADRSRPRRHLDLPPPDRYPVHLTSLQSNAGKQTPMGFARAWQGTCKTGG
jgi:hypothetical protein